MGSLSGTSPKASALAADESVRRFVSLGSRASSSSSPGVALGLPPMTPENAEEILALRSAKEPLGRAPGSAVEICYLLASSRNGRAPGCLRRRGGQRSPEPRLALGPAASLTDNPDSIPLSICTHAIHLQSVRSYDAR